MQGIRTFHLMDTDLSQLMGSILRELGDMSPALFLFFASTHYDLGAISRELKSAMPEAVVAGCSTAGELSNECMCEGSFAAIALSAEVTGGVVGAAEVENASYESLKKAITSLENRFGAKADSWEASEFLGLVLFEAMARQEEHLMDKLGDITNIPFIGGSAGDDLAFEKTSLYLNGIECSGPAVLILLKPTVSYDIMKTQSVRSLPIELTVSAADESERLIYEFNGKPATQAYAEALGIEVADIGSRFMTNPLGLLVGDDIFVRSIMKSEDTALRFYCSVLEGMSLRVLETTDIVDETKRVIEDEERTGGPIGAMIQFNCILRTLELKAKGRLTDYCATFGHIPTIGFSTYGEAYLGHINQTATMVLFR